MQCRRQLSFWQAQYFSYNICVCDDCIYITIICFVGIFFVKVFKLYDRRATRCSVGESCASGPPRCSCKALEGIKERRAGVRYSSWTCEGDLNPYETDIPSGTKCTTSCPAWRGLGDEPLVLESTCVEGNQWTSTRPSQPFGVRALPYVTPIYNTPDMEDMVCGCQDVGPFDYNPNNEDLAELVCTGGEPKDFDAPGGWNFTTTDRCDLFCNQGREFFLHAM